jgi:glycosyltransferase involved in cell wall biosynthesis
MAKFTIGIPTYNRANALRGALKTACEQTWHDVEVLVSDNASTDETPEVARSFGERVRYHRNAENIGMWRNFFRCAELAGGEYFAWLQDDDRVHCDFARRAVEAFESDRETVMYSSYTIESNSYDTFIYPQIYGPPVPMDWMNPRLRVIEGFLVVPISFFWSFSVPPVTAYRTEVIRRAIQEVDPESVLFNERIIQARAVADGGKVAVDPWPAGIYYKHEGNGSRLAGSLDIPERSRHWMDMADRLRRMLEERPDKDWRPLLDAWLEDISILARVTLLYQLPPFRYWSEFHSLTHEICSQLLNRVPEDVRDWYLAAGAAEENKKSFKNYGRQLTPPLVWDALRRVKRHLTVESK